MLKLRSFVPQIAINYLKHLPLAYLAAYKNGFPARQLKVIGVTGTDGKTTTVSLIYHILKAAGLPVGMISTVSAKINDEEIDTGFHVTAPDPKLLQKLLRKMVESGIKYVVLEVTSHGLDQFRVFGINYEIGVLTNITHEHLDYHKTFENYRQAKIKLLLNSKTAILNQDDPSFDFIAKLLLKKGIKVVTYSLKHKANLTPGNFKFKVNLPGDYNQLNSLAAIATAKNLGLDDEVIRKAVASFAGIAGRREEIKAGQAFKVYVDFAHTPNALEQILKALKSELKGKGKLWVVFGAAGLRDNSKRPLMGEVAGKYADKIILTAEDPRTEKVENICSEIVAGCKKTSPVPKIIPDRKEAIRLALQSAKKDDIVVICGKGHEKSMCFGTTEYPWSDQEVARKILREMKVSKVPASLNQGGSKARKVANLIN